MLHVSLLEVSPTWFLFSGLFYLSVPIAVSVICLSFSVFHPNPWLYATSHSLLPEPIDGIPEGFLARRAESHCSPVSLGCSRLVEFGRSLDQDPFFLGSAWQEIKGACPPFHGNLMSHSGS